MKSNWSHKTKFLKTVSVPIIILILTDLSFRISTELRNKLEPLKSAAQTTDSTNSIIPLPKSETFRRPCNKSHIISIIAQKKPAVSSRFGKLTGKKLPSAILIGAKKCGTGAIQFFLKNHSQIVVPKKEEMHFFDKQNDFWSIRPKSQYMRYLPPATRGEHVFEKTPGYSVMEKIDDKYSWKKVQFYPSRLNIHDQYFFHDFQK